MRTFTIHLRRHGLNPDQDIVILKDGFSWPAALIGGLWALWNRMWWVALGLIAVTAVTNGLGPRMFTDSVSPSVLTVAVAVLTGLLAHDLRSWTLQRQGFILSAVISARNSEDALRRYLDRDLDLAREINAIESRL